ncbi:cell division protein FtsQ/DivIB [Candidatus Sumerlaeota bacterium]|nr:cell division protein FtsQ/DivIB [Candidatus Sumerlaeota bacterium]
MKKEKKNSESNRNRDPFGIRVKWFFFRIFKVVLFGLCVVFSIWFGYRLHYFLFESPFFRIKKVEVAGVSEELQEEILHFIHLDDLENNYYNLLKYNVNALNRHLQTMPKLRSVRIIKDYPSTLRILAQPRKAISLISANGLFFADSEGVIMQKVQPCQLKGVVFPVITGLQETNIEPGTKIGEEAFFKALDIQGAFLKHNEILYDKLSEMNLNPQGDITAVFIGGAEIRFGRKDPLKRLPELDAFMKKFISPNMTLEGFRYVDLRFNKQIVYALR